MREPELIVLTGFPGSGKSTWAREYVANNANTVHIESDQIREELFSGSQKREHTSLTFQEMLKRTVRALKDGKDVVYDATNISYKDRRSILNSVPKNTVKKSRLFLVPFDVCVSRNEDRDNPVPYEAMTRMYKRFNIPLTSEGFEQCITHFDQEEDVEDYFNSTVNPMSESELERFIDVIKGDFTRIGFDINPELWLFANLSNIIPEGMEGYNLLQDNPNHTYTVSKHIYHVWESISLWKERDVFDTNGDTEVDWDSLAVAALFHDIGKPFTKGFVNGKGEPTDIAHYYGHENVSTYIALIVMCRIEAVLGKKVFDIYKVANLVQFHMKLYPYARREKAWKKLLAPSYMNELKLLNKADKLAK